MTTKVIAQLTLYTQVEVNVEGEVNEENVIAALQETLQQGYENNRALPNTEWAPTYAECWEATTRGVMDEDAENDYFVFN